MRVRNCFLGADGVGETTERALWERDVRTWDDFDGPVDGTPVGRTRARRIESFIETGRQRLRAGDAAFFGDALPGDAHWRLYRDFRDRACFFDIETTGLDRHRNEVTVVTVSRDGDTRTLVRGQDLTADRLRSCFDDAALLVSFNGRRFDVPFLEANFDLDLDYPHADLMSCCRTLGMSGGLDDVEARLGIERDDPDVSGEDAVRLWYEYRDGRQGALDRLVEYNREDTLNLVGVADAVTERLHEATIGAAGPDPAADGRGSG